MHPRRTASTRHRPVQLAIAGLGALLVAGAASCGGTVSNPATPPATTQPTTQAQPAASATPEDGEATATSEPARTPATIDDTLIAQARTKGMVSVIVTLAIPYTPESSLTPEQVERQRASIAAAQDELAASIPSATVTTRMTLLPQIVLSVDEDGLRQLAASPLVLALNENRLSAPTN